jgi:anti-sigma B factor antagonist
MTASCPLARNALASGTTVGIRWERIGNEVSSTRTRVPFRSCLRGNYRRCRTDNPESAQRTGFRTRTSGYHCEMLEVTVTESSPASTLITVSGELSGSGSERLLAKLDRLLDQGHRYVVLDLSAVGFCDSSGVSALVRGHARASAAAGGLRLSAASEQVTRVLELSGLARMLGLKSTVDTTTS